MKKQILFIHSAENQVSEQGSGAIVSYLKDSLGDDYEVLYPKMPDPEKPSYQSWKKAITKELAWLEDEIILIGHSLGGSVLLKYLAEEGCENPIAGLFIIAAPYWGKDEEWQVDEYILPKDFAFKLSSIPKMFFYHSRDDKWVSFAHLYYYKEDFPQATIRKFGVRGHNFVTGFPELVSDIRELGYRGLTVNQENKS